MKSRGVGSTADIVVLSLLLVLACLVLITSSSFRNNRKLETNAERTAQNTFLVFQQVPVKEFGNLSYVPDLPVEEPSKRVLREKTVVQLIAECVFLNSQRKINGGILESETNLEYEKELVSFLDNFLEKIIDGRFGFRFVIQLDSTKISGNGVLEYRKSIGDFDQGSRKLCSESLLLPLVFPAQHSSGMSERQSERVSLEQFFAPGIDILLRGNLIRAFQDPSVPSRTRVGPLRLTLEIWSR